jgi:hypothetical protein
MTQQLRTRGHSRPGSGGGVVDPAQGLGGDALLAVEGLGVGDGQEPERDSMLPLVVAQQELREVLLLVSACRTGKNALKGMRGMTEVTPALRSCWTTRGASAGGGGVVGVGVDGLHHRGDTGIAQVGQEIVVEGQPGPRPGCRR